ncbi:substrate-binding domain-containing protein [Nocardia tengchongensis]|uniref:Substrate-binding domain-containing protein n=1 Tax=Nocardia tengchongensis TaxID=2055889 RepID=A0ABX8D4G0_9NOCA|nr:substrate-binding domain-containing protein [Nocardia tengchongensis]
MTNRLVDDYGEAHPAERVEAVVGAVRKRFEGHSVRDFVPILVERIARRELDPKRSKNGAAQLDPAKSGPVAESGTSNSPDGHPADTSSVFAAVAGRFVPARLVEHKRVLGVAAAGVVAVTALAVVMAAQQSDSPSGGGTAAPALTTVHGVVGSEKSAFFDDPKVADALRKHGLQVEVEPAGSRQIATSVDLGKYDFAFPSSAAAAERIQRQRGVSGKYVPFSSPMAIATFKPIADLLTQAGIVQPGATTTFDVEKYLALAEKGVQWNQLDGNSTYAVPKNVLVSTTDPRTSNSAAMYLAVTAYVANDNTIVRGAKAEDYAVSRVSRLFTRQGFTESSSDGPFKDYLANGMGTVPMAWIYEAQYVDAAAHNQLKPDTVLMYPKPTIMSQHTVVPLTDKGDRLGKLLTTDPDLQRLAADHGFRPSDVTLFTSNTTAHQIPVDANLVNQVTPPDYDTLEHLLDGVAKSYN